MASLLVDITPLRESRDFTRLWWGLGVANFGAQLTVVAVGLEVYSITRDTFMVGLLGLAALIPLIVLGLYGGALVDHYDRRKVALAASTVAWVVTTALAVQAWLGVQNVWVLYGLVALQSAAFAVNNPARQAILPMLVKPQHMAAANSLMAITWNLALTGGPLAAAILVGQLGYGAAYTVDAVLFLVALWALFKLPAMLPADLVEHNLAAQNGAVIGRKRVGLASVLDGLKYLNTQPNVRMTFLVDLAAMVLAMPRVLFPAIGMVVLGGGEFTVGVLTAAFAVGGILAGLLSGGLTRLTKQGAIIAGAITCWGLSIVAFGMVIMAAGQTSPDETNMPLLIWASVTLVLAGGSDAISAVFRQTILQTATPDRMRGRLQGVFIVVVAGGPRLGELWIGAQSTWFTEGGAAIIGGLTCIAVLWGLLKWQPSFLKYDSRNPVP